MQFNELKATVMDYIWLIRDSLSANNAIYFQSTIFVFFCKTRHISTDEGFFTAVHVPLPLFMDTQIFAGGWVMNSSWLLFRFPTLPYSLGVNSILGLGSCHFAAPPGILLPREPWSKPPLQTQPRAKVRREGQTLSRARRSPAAHGRVEAAHLELLQDVWEAGEEMPRWTLPSSTLHTCSSTHASVSPPVPLLEPLGNVHRYMGLAPGTSHGKENK